MNNKGIIMLSFGTTYEDARKKNIHRLTDEVRKFYPEYLVREAFSSPRVRKILQERDGIRISSLTEAMEEMKAAGIKSVTVFPTHIIGGFEYEKCKAEFETHASAFEHAVFGTPLFWEEEDYRQAAEGFWDEFKCQMEEKDSQVLLMGHGTSHLADDTYRKLEETFRRFCSPSIYLTTVEGALNTERALSLLDPSRKKVYLAPFMLVAGDHAVNDMAGEEDSIAATLNDNGYEPECIIKGLGEYGKVRDIYLAHLKKTLNADKQTAMSESLK